MNANSPAISVLTALILIIALLVSASAGQAATTSSATISTATGTNGGDTYIVRNNSDENDDLMLRASYDITNYEASSIILLQFDLSSIGFDIDKARLSLSAGCFQIVGNLTIALYAADEDTYGWDEESADWDNANDSRGLLLIANLDEGDTSGGAGTYHYTDDGSGIFADYLESERANDLDKVASLWLEAKSVEGTNTDVLFQDREESFGCKLPGGPPQLQLADAQEPLAVQLVSLEAYQSPPDLSLPLSLCALAALLGGGWIWGRTRLNRQ